jgi:MFS family permease
MIGSQVTLLALPVTAAVSLGASSLQMGILSALGSIPALLFGLFAGVWVDRSRRRPVLVWADIARALVLAIIPLSALLGMLRVVLLYIVAFLAGAFGLIFDIAYRSYLPSLVGRDQLIRANSQLELSGSVAEIIGPGVAGGLLQVIEAPLAIAADAFSFLASLSLFNAMYEAVQILFLTRQIGLAAGWLGVIFAGGSVGFVLGALVTQRLTQQIGLGRSMLWAVVLLGASDLLVPLMALIGQLWLVVLLLVLAQFCFGIALTIFRIGHVSLRQSLTPDHLQGRMNATLNVLTWGIVPLGGLLGGAMGEAIGLSLTLVFAALGEMLSMFWLFFSPVRVMQQVKG